MMWKRPTYVAVVIAAISFASARASEAKTDNPSIPDELLIRFKIGTPHDQAMTAIGASGSTLKDEIPALRIKRLKVSPSQKERVRDNLLKNPHIEFVEDNFVAAPAAVPDDPFFTAQWHHNRIASPAAWDTSTGSETVTIAIIDSGIDVTHPDLATKILPGYSFVKESNDVGDTTGHGTAVAGSAAAIAGNGSGVAGVTWKSPLLPLAVIDPVTNTASYYNIARALTFAADHSARIINVSIGGSASSSTLDTAVAYAWKRGAIIFAAAMNNNTNTRYYPAACPNVVAVAATTSSDTKASFSNYGDWIVVSAPGEQIMTTNRGGGYGGWNGTSFASPIAAGTAALVLAVNPGLSNLQVVSILEQTADDLGTPGFDTSFGHGRINAAQAVLTALGAAPEADTVSPVIAISAPTVGATVSGTVPVAVDTSDNAAVVSVYLLINGTIYGTSTTPPFGFSWDSTGTPDGSVTLTATARDAAGNESTSIPVKVNVVNFPDTIAPVVEITSPRAGGNIGNKVTIEGRGSDNVGVVRIEIHIDGTVVATTENSVISHTWNSRKAAAGIHVITLKAHDAAGNIGTASITVVK